MYPECRSSGIMSGQLVGRIIDGRYRIEKWLGGGAMGDVYLAAEIAGGVPVRRVALKILKDGEPSGIFHGEHFNDCTFPARILDSSADYE
jgi:eukaryotic-like serine/threonine-protein kinase